MYNRKNENVYSGRKRSIDNKCEIEEVRIEESKKNSCTKRRRPVSCNEEVKEQCIRNCKENVKECYNEYANIYGAEKLEPCLDIILSKCEKVCDKYYKEKCNESCNRCLTECLDLCRKYCQTFCQTCLNQCIEYCNKACEECCNKAKNISILQGNILNQTLGSGNNIGFQTTYLNGSNITTPANTMYQVAGEHVYQVSITATGSVTAPGFIKLTPQINGIANVQYATISVNSAIQSRVTATSTFIISTKGTGATFLDFIIEGNSAITGVNGSISIVELL